jgi:myosin heavy subunit
MVTGQTKLFEESSSDVLKKLTTQLESAGSELLNERFERIQEQMEKVEKIKDAQKRNIAEGVIKAELDQLVKDSMQGEQDFADAVSALDEMIEQFGSDFEKLVHLNAEEQKLIDDAKADLESAKSAWWSREAKTAQAESALKEAEAQAKKSMRSRLKKANYELSTQIFQQRARETIRIMQAGMKSVSEQLKNVSARKKEAFKTLDQAAVAMKELEGKTKRAEAQLRNAEEELAGLTNGTPEFVATQAKVSDLREKVTALNGDYNIALGIHQSKERFAAQLEVHEITNTKLRDNLRNWIAVLESDTQERVATILSRLEAAKRMVEQEVAAQLDKMGAKFDQENTEFMAKAGRVSDDLRMKRVEEQAPRMRDLVEVMKGQAQASKDIQKREDAVRQDFMKRYGIDPFAGSFLARAEETASRQDAA